MKKILCLAVVFAFITVTYGQRAMVKESLRNLQVQAEKITPADGSEVLHGNVVPYKATTLVEESEMGETWYDKQSNRAVANRVYLYPDGTAAAVWTYGINATGFDDRGAGYNYFDGNNWGAWPTSRVESVRSGWPSYAPLGENGEIIVSHDAVDELFVNRRAEKGTGDWTETTLQGPPGNEKITWPRVMTEGVDNNIVHILGQIRDYPAGSPMTLGYFRSMDGGETWDLENYEIPGTNYDDYTELGADSYTFAEPRNGVIAFFVANLWCDAFIMKSSDHGDTWEKIIVWEHPYPFYNDETIFTDTLWAPDNSGHIALDSEGKAHVVFGLGRTFKDAAGTTFTHWPGLQDGIVYWNEDMDPFEHSNQHKALDPYEVLVEDVNLIGWSQDVDGNGELDFTDDILSYSSIGLSTMPNITIDENDHIYVVWASTTEGYDNGINNYKHVWSRMAINPEWGWSEFHDLTDDLIHIFDECVYPQVAPLSDDYLHVMFNTDANPGNAVDDDHEYQQNKQLWSKIDKDDLVSIDESAGFTVENVAQNYPNPCSVSTLVKVELDQPGLLSLEVNNLMGQKVTQLPERKVNAGTHMLTVDVSGLQPGVYIYSVISNGKKVNRKMIVE